MLTHLGGSSGGGSSPRGHGSRDSDSDDSLSGDYPRGWGIPKRRQSSPRDPTGGSRNVFEGRLNTCSVSGLNVLLLWPQNFCTVTTELVLMMKGV